MALETPRRAVRPEILLVHADPPEVETLLAARFTVHALERASDPEAMLADTARRARGLVTGTLVGASGDLIGRLPDLEIVAITGGHVDKLDLAACRSRGIRVVNAPGVSAPDVADHGLALLLAVARRLCAGDRFIRAGEWPAGKMRFGHRVEGKRAGIVGLGRIGRLVARRLAAFEMPVAYHGPRPKSDVPYPYYPDLIAMAREVDVLVVTCKAGPETYHLIGAEVLEALGSDGFLINVARGGVVDERALTAALRDQMIAGAGLDVFEREPEVPAELLALDSVVVQPHTGAYTVEAKRQTAELAVENLLAHFAGGPLLTPVL